VTYHQNEKVARDYTQKLALKDGASLDAIRIDGRNGVSVYAKGEFNAMQEAQQPRQPRTIVKPLPKSDSSLQDAYYESRGKKPGVDYVRTHGYKPTGQYPTR
jgi:hypothetical protein